MIKCHFSIFDTIVQHLKAGVILNAGQSVEIDGVGTFEKLPLFPDGLNHRNNIALARVAKKKMVSFKASDYLTKNIA